MKNQWESHMMEYYEERAIEYDEIYQGKGPGIAEPGLYTKDVNAIKAIARDFGRGHLIDIGCGTGYWLPYYGMNCKEITLVDQSRRMLGECQKRIKELGTGLAVHFVKGNFMDMRFFSKVYDASLIGFFISHLPEDGAYVFWKKLKQILKPNADVLWIDGSWSDTRRKHRTKEGFQTRTLNDGRSFKVYKRYFEAKDIRKILKKYSFILHSLYMGEVFFAASASMIR